MTSLGNFSLIHYKYCPLETKMDKDHVVYYHLDYVADQTTNATQSSIYLWFFG